MNRFLLFIPLLLFFPIGLFFQSPSQNNLLTPTETDFPKRISPTPTPITLTVVLTATNPTDLELERFISIEHLGIDPESTEKLFREEIDVTSDGEEEIIFGGTTYGAWVPFLAIFSRPINNKTWGLIFYQSDESRYFGNVRVAIDDNRIIADFLTAGGGTGFIELEWQQRWIECHPMSCEIIWESPILKTWQYASSILYIISRGYQVAEFEQPNPETIYLTINDFSLENVPNEYHEEDYRLVDTDRTYWVTGPKLQQVYQWDGGSYQLVDEEQIVSSAEIVRQFDSQANATSSFVSNILSKDSDYEEYKQARADFWGLAYPDNLEDGIWGAWYSKLDAATSDGFVHQYHIDEETTTWVAGVISAIDRPLCRLTVQNYLDGSFGLVERVELPCIPNLTRLDYADVNGDGQSELLLLTIALDSEEPATTQRLHIYSIDDKLVEIVTIDGVINGPDMVGVRWEKSKNGFKVFAGLPLVKLNCGRWDWSCITSVREFEAHEWNMETDSFQLLTE